MLGSARYYVIKCSIQSMKDGLFQNIGRATNVQYISQAPKVKVTCFTRISFTNPPDRAVADVGGGQTGLVGRASRNRPEIGGTATATMVDGGAVSTVPCMRRGSIPDVDVAISGVRHVRVFGMGLRDFLTQQNISAALVVASLRGSVCWSSGSGRSAIASPLRRGGNVLARALND